MRRFVYRRAGAVVVSADGERVLVIGMQPPGEPRWFHFPGGGIEDGERAEEAARRELFEETGLSAVSARPFLRAGVHGGEHEYFAVTCEETVLGEVTGPEVVYAAGQDFRAEWVPISSLASMPVWPRCVAEHLVDVGGVADVPWFEDDRSAWDGLGSPDRPAEQFRRTARSVIVDAGRVAAIARKDVDDGDRWFTLPGGGIEAGETPEMAAVREAKEELGLDVEAGARLAVVFVGRGDHRALQTYVWCTVRDPIGGAPTDGDRQSHRPVWLDVADLPATLRPSWFAERLPSWIVGPSPTRPERFCEIHDDD